MKKLYQNLFKKFFFLTAMAILPIVGWAQEQGYAVLDIENGILTFKYGEMPEGDNVYKILNEKGTPGWLGTPVVGSGFTNANKITKVVFDQSFAQNRPHCTSYWFSWMTNLTEIVGLENLNTSEVSDMSGMFNMCIKLESLDLRTFDTSKVADMSFMFYYCRNLATLDLTSFNTQNVVNMFNMFSYCDNLIVIDLTNFNTANVTNMSDMFNHCTYTQTINVGSFDTKNVVQMCGMFDGCSSLSNLDVSIFNTAKVENMSKMFAGCYNLSYLDVSSFITNNVTDMSDMFSSCFKLTNLDTSNFDTNNVTNMSGMFDGCRSLLEIDVKSFNTEKVNNMSQMFYDCNSISTLNLENFNTNGVKYTYRMIGKCESLHSVILGEEFNTINIDFPLFNSYTNALSLIEFVGNLPDLNDNTFNDVGSLSNPVELVVPSQFTANYASKIGADGKFYGGYFKLNGYSADTSMPEPNVGTKRLTTITREREGYDLERTDMSYDDKGRIVKLVYSNGTRTKIGNYKYDNDVISIVYDNSFKHEFRFANGKVSTAPMNLESERLTGTRIFEYDASDQLIKVTVSVDGSRTQDNAIIEWNNGNPSNILLRTLNTSTNVEQEMWNSTVTPNGMSAEPVIRALFGICFQGRPTFDISDDIYEFIAFYPYIGKLPQQLVGQVDYRKSGKLSVYNYSYEKDGNGNITKVTITCDGKATVYTLTWDDSSTGPITPPVTELPTTDNGNEAFSDGGSVDSNTDLNGNVVGNVYYNIASGNGGYNAVEGCIEITKPTSDSDIDGKDIFGEDFKNHFTGIVFKVAAGKGTIKVNAQAVGSMMIKVKVGSNGPNEMMLTGKVEAKFPYNVTEPTYVYIYASSFTGSASNRAAASSSDILRIYGISWGETSGIEEMPTGVNQKTDIYTLDGRKLKGEPSEKGIYIIGGKKVIIK